LIAMSSDPCLPLTLKSFSATHRKDKIWLLTFLVELFLRDDYLTIFARDSI
jgi:hypothetical protein